MSNALHPLALHRPAEKRLRRTLICASTDSLFWFSVYHILTSPFVTAKRVLSLASASKTAFPLDMLDPWCSKGTHPCNLASRHHWGSLYKVSWPGGDCRLQGVTEVFSFNLEKSKVMLALGDRRGEVRSWRWEKWRRDGCGTGGEVWTQCFHSWLGHSPLLLSSLQHIVFCSAKTKGGFAVCSIKVH